MSNDIPTRAYETLLIHNDRPGEKACPACQRVLGHVHPKEALWLHAVVCTPLHQAVTSEAPR